MRARRSRATAPAEGHAVTDAAEASPGAPVSSSRFSAATGRFPVTTPAAGKAPPARESEADTRPTPAVRRERHVCEEALR